MLPGCLVACNPSIYTFHSSFHLFLRLFLPSFLSYRPFIYPIARTVLGVKVGVTVLSFHLYIRLFLPFFSPSFLPSYCSFIYLIARTVLDVNIWFDLAVGSLSY
jgi:hypothetical protein